MSVLGSWGASTAPAKEHVETKESILLKQERLCLLGIDSHNQEQLHLHEDDIQSSPVQCLIHPFSAKRICWDLFMGLLLIYVAFATPVRIGFGSEATGAWQVFERFIDAVFLVDVGLNFRWVNDHAFLVHHTAWRNTPHGVTNTPAPTI